MPLVLVLLERVTNMALGIRIACFSDLSWLQNWSRGWPGNEASTRVLYLLFWTNHTSEWNIPLFPLLHSYTSLLSQYMAVSYGDALFSCFLLLPLQQRFAPQLRKVVWGDHPSIPRLLTLPVTQVGVRSLTAIKSLRLHLLHHCISLLLSLHLIL